MSVTIGSARRDENGKYSGGKAGDQDKVEVSTQAYYLHSKGWYLYRALSEEHAKALAQAMYDACMNDNVGYDQTNRAIMTMLDKYGSMAEIAEKTETDCSNLVRGCIYQATGIDLGNFNTASEPNVLDKSGLFAKKQTVTSSTKFKLGDILVTKSKGHTVIIVSIDGVMPGQPAKKPDKPAGATPKIESARSKSASLAGTYKTTKDLPLKSGAGKNKTTLIVIKKGEKVRNYGYYTDAEGAKWLYVAYGEKTGFCSSAYLKKV